MVTYLALHYWAGAGREFDLLPLPPGARLLAPDLPGFGAQAAPAGFDYSVKSYADWLAAYIHERQLTDYQLIGHSMGASLRWRWRPGSRQACGACCCCRLRRLPPSPLARPTGPPAGRLSASGPKPRRRSTRLPACPCPPAGASAWWPTTCVPRTPPGMPGCNVVPVRI
ncbi:alpha/beta fold hydrolase [Hymenobacter sp. BRD67]|nr:alpha/beta fold hydrolase [Hymenobacter sp. BRD67]